MESPLLGDTCIQVDLSAIGFNMDSIKKMAGPETAIAPVVKADGYGHGAVAIAPTIMEHGGRMLAVATLSEAIQLKEAHPQYPVLVMGLTPDRCLPYVVEYGIRQTIDTLAQGELLSRLALERGRKALVHIKYDTGFHRIGFPDCQESITQIAQLCRLPGLGVEGFFSHLALAGQEENQQQFGKFMAAAKALKGLGITFPYRHLADSIAAVDYPSYRLDMIRAGALVYGLKGFHIGSLELRQALTFKTKIIHITQVKKGEGVSYDYLWRASHDTRVATLPFGYGDGYPRNLSGKAKVTIKGKLVPVIGVICMDQCMADLTQAPEAQVGDEVTIYGDGTGNTLDIQAISQLAGTNKNEILARLGRRPQRIYVAEKKDGQRGDSRRTDAGKEDAEKQDVRKEDAK